jgi:hypothetical protein
MAERLADRRSRREQKESGQDLLFSLLPQPRSGDRGFQLFFYPPPHTHIWKMFLTTGLLEDFWDMAPGGK